MPGRSNSGSQRAPMPVTNKPLTSHRGQYRESTLMMDFYLVTLATSKRLNESVARSCRRLDLMASLSFSTLLEAAGGCGYGTRHAR